MYWIPSILNQANLFKRYVDYIDSDKTPTEVKNRLDELLFRANVVWCDIQAIRSDEQVALTLVESYKKQLLLPTNRCAVAAPPIFMMSSRIGSALASLRIMQDMIRYVAPTLFGNGVSMPKSLADACKRGLSTYFDNKDVIEMIQSYWDASGEKLRAMRIIDQHYENLMGKTFYDKSGNTSRILMLLPDNPEEQSPRKFQYKKEVHATDFLISAFHDLHALYDGLAKLAGFKPGLHQASADLAHVGILRKNEERTLGLLIDITSVKKSNAKTVFVLDTIEIKQVIPKKDKGNIAVRKMLTDSEVVTEKEKNLKMEDPK
jgi:hypothetical protein